MIQMIQGWLARPGFLRWWGLFGSVCCAAGAFAAGAFPTLPPVATVVTLLRGPNGPLIMLVWVVGLTALCTAWWHGRPLVDQRALSTRWILTTAALWSLPMLIVPPLGSRDLYSNACQGALFDAGLNPYVVGVSAQPCPWLDSVSPIWRDTPTPYGPVFIVLAGAAAAFGSQIAAFVVLRLLAVAGTIGIAAGLPVLARRVGVPADRALWLVLCCPLVPLHLIGGGHSDAITIAAFVAGLAVLAPPSKSIGALILGGALVGLSIAIKTTIGVVLPFAALLAAGGLPPGGWPRLVRRGGTVVAAALGVLVVTSIGSGLGFGWTSALSGAGKSINWSSPPTAVGIAIDNAGSLFGADLDAVPVVRLIALVLLAVALPVIWWRFRRRDPLVGAALAFLAVIFAAPIVNVWYLLWPLALLAVTRVRVRWFFGTVAFATFVLLPDGNGIFQPLKATLSFVMTGVVCWVGHRVLRWLRGVELVELPPAVAPPRELEPAG